MSVAQRFRRLLVGLLLVGLGAAAPLAVMATHNFSDVPASNFAHTSIERIYDARITTGCTATTYCPGTAVTREQMAAFLARAGGRVGYNSLGQTAISTSTPTLLAEVWIQPGGESGGTAFIKLDASVTAYISGGCADGCQVTYWIQEGVAPSRKSANFLGWFHNTSTQQESAATSLVWVNAQPTNVLTPYGLWASLTAGSPSPGAVWATGALSAEYFPFSEDGNDVLGDP